MIQYKGQSECKGCLDLLRKRFRRHCVIEPLRFSLLSGTICMRIQSIRVLGVTLKSVITLTTIPQSVRIGLSPSYYLM